MIFTKRQIVIKKMGKNERIGKYNRKKFQKRQNKAKSKNKKKKLIIIFKNHFWKRMRFIFFFQTSNVHPNKQKYKS